MSSNIRVLIDSSARNAQSEEQQLQYPSNGTHATRILNCFTFTLLWFCAAIPHMACMQSNAIQDTIANSLTPMPLQNFTNATKEQQQQLHINYNNKVNINHSKNTNNNNSYAYEGDVEDFSVENSYLDESVVSSKAASKPHSRRKRFLAFPLGSSFSTAACMTTGVLGNPNYQYLSMGLNWGLAYDLPNATWVLEHSHVFTKSDTPMSSTESAPASGAADDVKDSDMENHSNDTAAADAEAEKNIQMVKLPMIKRRQRRELYSKLELLING